MAIPFIREACVVVVCLLAAGLVGVRLGLRAERLSHEEARDAQRARVFADVFLLPILVSEQHAARARAHDGTAPSSGDAWADGAHDRRASGAPDPTPAFLRIHDRTSGAIAWLASRHSFCFARDGEPFRAVVDGPGVGANVDAGALPREIADHSPLIRCVRTMGASSSRAPRVALSFERGGTPWTVRAPVARVRCAENATAPLPSWIAHSDPSSRPDAGAAVGSLAALHIPGLVHALGQTVNIYHEYDQVFDYVAAESALATRRPDLRPDTHQTDALIVSSNPRWVMAKSGRSEPTIEGGPAARVCTGSQSTCLKALLAEQRRQPVLSADALFLAFDRAAAAAAATDAPTTDAPTADARHVDLICPEHTLFWRVVAAKRSPPTSALVRAALGSAVLGRAWRGASNATGGAGGRQIRPPPSSQLDVVQLARPPTDGGYGNVDAVAALIAQAAAGARVRFRRVRSLAFSADGWPMVRQAEALSTAAVFVAPHGAGLTHLNWMPPGGCVVEVFPECVYDPSYTHWAAARGDVHYFGILNGTQATRPMARWKHAFHKFRASPLCSAPSRDTREVRKRFGECRQHNLLTCWPAFRTARQDAHLPALREALERCFERRARDEASGHATGSERLLLATLPPGQAQPQNVTLPSRAKAPVPRPVGSKLKAKPWERDAQRRPLVASRAPSGRPTHSAEVGGIAAAADGAAERRGEEPKRQRLR
ncbi:hypothetical protein KFE25_000906 [Diacronema lutheri]|uniref:Uncharacterized protein n=2 Tax=Diacronema lutheri TaxID=2081491 RepID=A0A8J5XIR8_DIALT|nr:hypothetical protein KFE25_000906 [Diacronema lutheri]